jgi:hypothetical protein
VSVFVPVLIDFFEDLLGATRLHAALLSLGFSLGSLNHRVDGRYSNACTNKKNFSMRFNV